MDSKDTKIEKCYTCHKILTIQKFMKNGRGVYKFFRAHIKIEGIDFLKQGMGQNVSFGITPFCSRKCLIKFVDYKMKSLDDRIRSKKV